MKLLLLPEILGAILCPVFCQPRWVIQSCVFVESKSKLSRAVVKVTVDGGGLAKGAAGRLSPEVLGLFSALCVNGFDPFCLKSWVC